MVPIETDRDLLILPYIFYLYKRVKELTKHSY